MKRTRGSTVSLLLCSGLFTAGLLGLVAGCSPGQIAGRRDGGGGGDDASVEYDAGNVPTPFDLSTCVNLQCRQVSCPAGQETTLSGTVLTPKGDLPLYNVSVFVPNASVLPFAEGASCDSCSSFSATMPLVSALTGPDGKFTLKKVPAGANVPLVLQVGKWRKQIVIPIVQGCTSVVLDPAMLKMPRNKLEGEIPKIAIATGAADPFECLLTKVGLDTAEVTTPSGTGRINYYRNLHPNPPGQPVNGIDLAGGAPDATTLFEDPVQLKKYDIILLPCEGAEWGGKSATAAANMKAYADLGGRLFTTHYSYTWLYGIKDTPTPLPWSATGSWNVNQHFDDSGGASQFVGKIDATFPKGMAFAQWLTNVGASLTAGQLAINEWRHDLDLAAIPPATRWLFGGTPAYRYRNTTLCFSNGDCAAGNQPCVNNRCTDAVPLSTTDNSVQHITFNTPIDKPVADQCGRVVYSDFHVSASALKDGTDPTNLGTFPSVCKDQAPSAQEKALIFMLFDLSACVQDDSIPPAPPPPIL